MVTHCIDTSALIKAWQVDYPIDNFLGFWERIEGLIAAERLVAPEEVLRETKKRSDELHAWLNAYKEMFRELHEEISWKQPRFWGSFRAWLANGSCGLRPIPW